MNLPDETSGPAVVHNRTEQQFELPIGEACCVLQYRIAAGRMIVYHTEVPAPFERRGFAARMTRAAFAFAREENLKIEPRCPYTAYFLHKHPEFSDLVD